MSRRDWSARLALGVSARVVATGRVDRSTVAAIRDALVGGGAERGELARLHSVGVISRLPGKRERCAK